MLLLCCDAQLTCWCGVDALAAVRRACTNRHEYGKHQEKPVRRAPPPPPKGMLPP